MSRLLQHADSRRLIALFVVGLTLRLPGVLFNGVADIYQMVLDWGFDVRALGLARAFDINYGVLSYAVFGAVARLAEEMPRFWWAPYKLAVVLFEVGVLAVLVQLVRPAERTLVTWLYWLNPWVILHGGFLGFWEGAYLLCALWGIVALRRIRSDGAAWLACGALLMCSAMLKPQGLVHFVGPLGLYLAVRSMRGSTRPLQGYGMGVAAVVVSVSLLLWLAGGSALGVYHNYAFTFTTMPNLSNGGPNLWRLASFAMMEVLGQTGEVSDLRPGRIWVAGLSLVATAVSGAVLLLFASRMAGPTQATEPRHAWSARLHAVLPRATVELPPPAAALLFLVIGALVMSQFGVRAHINHSYGATVLLIPFVAANRRLRPWWVVIVGIQALAELSTYGLGSTLLIPPPAALSNYPHATVLIEAVRGLAAFREPDALLRAHETINGWLGRLANSSVISIVSLAMFVCTIGILRELWRQLAGGVSASNRVDGLPG